MVENTMRIGCRSFKIKIMNQRHLSKNFLDIILKVYIIFLIRLLDLMILIHTTLVKVFYKRNV